MKEYTVERFRPEQCSNGQTTVCQKSSLSTWEFTDCPLITVGYEKFTDKNLSLHFAKFLVTKSNVEIYFLLDKLTIDRSNVH